MLGLSREAEPMYGERGRDLFKELAHPLEEGMQPTLVFLLAESHAQRILVGYSPWGHKESDLTEAHSTGFTSLQ